MFRLALGRFKHAPDHNIAYRSHGNHEDHNIKFRRLSTKFGERAFSHATRAARNAVAEFCAPR